MTMDKAYEFEVEFNGKTMTKEQIDKILGREPGRPEILQSAVPVYDRESSRYPDSIRVSFMDGHTEIYDLRIEQPAPVIVENIRIIRKWKPGYVNKPMRRRNRT